MTFRGLLLGLLPTTISLLLHCVGHVSDDVLLLFGGISVLLLILFIGLFQFKLRPMLKMRLLDRLDEGADFNRGSFVIACICVTSASWTGNTTFTAFSVLGHSVSMGIACVSICIFLYGHRLYIAIYPNKDEEWCDLPSEAGVANSFSTETDTHTALSQAIQDLKLKLNLKLTGEMPDFVVLQCTCNHDGETIKSTMDSLLPNVPYIGGTTCRGVMSETGWHTNDKHNTVLGLLGIKDSEGRYAVVHGKVEMNSAVRSHSGSDNASDNASDKASDNASDDVVSDGNAILRSISRLSTKVETEIGDKIVVNDVRRIAMECTMKVLERGKLNREGKEETSPHAPSFVWVSISPGIEEDVLDGIRSVIGTSVPIVGGSSADNDVKGEWFQCTSQDFRFTQSLSNSNGFAMAVSYGSIVTEQCFFSGYTPTSFRGKITKMKSGSRRTIMEIDHLPAADVYNRWTGGELTSSLTDGKSLNVLGKTTLFPLGRKIGERDEEPFFQIIHPSNVNSDKSFDTFANVEIGDELYCMAGTSDNLKHRISKVASFILRGSSIQLNEVIGALVVFCAGCMLRIEKDMDVPCRKLSSVLGNAPFLGMHTFGEQGIFPNGNSMHGNLMFSVLLFTSKRKIRKMVNSKTGETKIISRMPWDRQQSDQVSTRFDEYIHDT